MTITRKLSNRLKKHGLGATQIQSAVNVGSTLDSTEYGFVDGITAGTTAASKALVLDSNSELDGVGKVKVADTLVTTAQVKALNATPIEMVAAPGAGISLQFLGAYVFLDYESAAYADDAGEDLVFEYNDGSGEAVSLSADGSLFDGTADALVWVAPIDADATNNSVTLAANVNIAIHILTGEWITGDSPLKVRVLYREVRTAAMEAIS